MKAWWPSGEEEVCTLLCQTQLPDSHAALPVLQISHHHQAQFGSKRSSWSEQQFNIVHYNLKVKQRWKSWHVKTTNYFIYLFFLKGGGVEILTRTKTYSGCHLPSSATASEYHLPYFNLFYFIRPPRKLIFFLKIYHHFNNTFLFTLGAHRAHRFWFDGRRVITVRISWSRQWWREANMAATPHHPLLPSSPPAVWNLKLPFRLCCCLTSSSNW